MYSLHLGIKNLDFCPVLILHKHNKPNFNCAFFLPGYACKF